MYFWRISSWMPVQLMENTTDLYFVCGIKKATQRKYTLCNAIDFLKKQTRNKGMLALE